jgi:MHS family dicarboxylic acid transporter PcaT-like MFS transporter
VTLIGGQLLAVLVIVVLQQLLDDAELKVLGLAHPVRDRRHPAVIALFLRRTLHENDRARPARKGRAACASCATTARLPHRDAGLHGRRLADLLHLHHLHAEVPGQLGRHVDQDGQQRDDGCLFLYMCMQPLFGALSDRIGRRTTCCCSARWAR